MKARQADLAMEAYHERLWYEEEQRRLQGYYELVLLLMNLDIKSASDWMNDYRHS